MRRYTTRVLRIPLVVVLLFAMAGGPTSAAPGAQGSALSAAGPQFLTAPRDGDALEIALEYLRTHRKDLGLTAADIADVAVTDRYVSEHSGVTHIYLRQRFGGIEVESANVNINVAADGSVINLGGSFVSNLNAAARGQAATRDAATSVKDAARQLGLAAPAKLKVKEARGGKDQEVVFTENGISLEPITTKLVYQILDDGKLRLAWQIELYQPDGEHWWNLRVDARTGAILDRDDYMSDVDDSYNVFALPKESPTDGDRSVVLNPADATASPFGWHDTNGTSGAEFTITRGNNVHAYTDTDANNVEDPGSEPNSATLEFDLPLDLTQEPSTYRPFAVSNLFYWNNVIHDVFYGYGFDEEAGNFQVNNYGNEGLAGDYVRAEAQDGSGLNNANFGTPVDGMRPRMQMFVWRGPLDFIVNSPVAIAGPKEATSAGFGPVFPIAGLTGNVVIATDDGPVTTDGCTAINNGAAVAGNIALVDRGTCEFSTKVFNAQSVGAVAVIVVNNVPGPPAGMAPGVLAPQVTIPSTMISLADGNAIKANIAAPVNVTISSTQISRDSDLDAGVIIHEYGHGISNRLTGGPANVSCLQNAEQMGEGWSDWLALTLTAAPTDTGSTGRGIGTYVIFQGADGLGIRPARYTTDLSVNPYTYGRVATDTANGTLTVPHGVGFVWASMIWEVYWNLTDKHGFNPDVYGEWTTGGNNLAIQLVIDGMKLQPCSPGFVDGRNAILLADQVLTFGANQCEIWEGFAKRGLGFSASQGLSTSNADGVEAFDLPPTCTDFTGFAGSVRNPPTLNSKKAGATVPATFSLSGDQGLDIFAAGYPQSGQVDCTTLAPIGPLQPTANPAGNPLSYDATTDRYTYPWKTVGAWMNTCRALVLRFTDNVNQVAYFSFKP